jgi:leader peptidase (prepilin peptidase)/N-methyltransferase
VPHGPFLLSGAAVGLFAGAPLWDGYLRLVGLA